MAGKSLGPSVVLFPVRTSTTHDELLCWQVVPPCASPSTIISELHDDIDLSSLLQTAAILGFGGMGLTPFGGQQTLNLIWPISVRPSPGRLGVRIQRIAFWTCNLLCRMHQAYSSKEIPSLKPYSSNEISSLNFEPENKPQTAASSMEHFNESSYASIARAHYDHKLIQDF
ncbi:hypothetical protein AXX17_AT1G38600 [Arabidopsis thaliana]|uniref:Uncharacterized protein n=1 Tax=Arabidopsis thaliana TaxID=3702 RepID=A0A178W7D5_ARATH|nr:hypothetical protein AXX17_AT1G38600 [Arabidopsis thaliana]